MLRQVATFTRRPPGGYGAPTFQLSGRLSSVSRLSRALSCQRAARCAGLLVFLSSAMPAWADYLVQRGDVLFVSIAEDRDAGREAKVNADGRIMLPHIGGVPAAGSDLDAIRGRIETALSDQGIIRKPTVVVEVSTYRPVYVGGAVARPGAIGFEVGLTVRQALVLAGGVDKSRSPGMPTTADLLDLKAKFKVNAAELVEVDSEIARLNAELAGSSGPDTGTTAAPDDDTAPITALDGDLLRDELAAKSSDQAHLQDLVGLVDFELDVLSKQATLQEEERETQQSQVDTAKSLHEQGLVPLPRVQELERERSRLDRDLLENQAFAARARQNKASSEYDLATAETKWRIELREKLRAALLQRMKFKAESEVIAGSLVAAGISLTSDSRLQPAEPDLTIHRRTDGGDQEIHATMDTEILPADVLDVTLAATGGEG